MYWYRIKMPVFISLYLIDIDEFVSTLFSYEILMKKNQCIVFTLYSILEQNNNMVKKIQIEVSWKI